MAAVAFLFISYLLTRLAYLTRLPVFNDEAIYIDWGQKMLASGKFYLPLFDGKQPLLMWVFGLFANIFPDPLFGARLVSVLCGFLSLLAIYRLAQSLFSISAARLASLLYLLSPLSLFFDRQALMESALTCLGLWSVYLLHRLMISPKVHLSICLGLLWGLGLSIKSSFGVFILASAIIFVYSWRRRLPELIQHLCLIFPATVVILLPLLLQPDFHQIVDQNSRFSFTLAELFRFPLTAWKTNFLSLITISFWQYLGPLLIVIPVYLIKSFSRHRAVIVWYLLCLIVYCLTIKSAAPRYLVSFLPLNLIFAAAWLTQSAKKYAYSLLAASLAWFIFLDLQLLINPLSYFRSLHSLTAYSQADIYTGTFTSGYGVKPALDYLVRISAGSPVLVGTRLDAGNPEDAVFFYLSKYPRIRTAYLDSRILRLSPGQTYLSSSIPIYFVTRNNQLAGLDSLAVKLAEFTKPDGVSSVVVYQLKTTSSD